MAIGFYLPAAAVGALRLLFSSLVGFFASDNVLGKQRGARSLALALAESGGAPVRSRRAGARARAKLCMVRFRARLRSECKSVVAYPMFRKHEAELPGARLKGGPQVL